LFEMNAATGECGGGIFFRDASAVMVRRFDRETIEAAVAALFTEGDITPRATQETFRRAQPSGDIPEHWPIRGC
jgi:hypothetical protein